MTSELETHRDGVALARSVRAVAARARTTLGSPPASTDMRELLATIDDLERDARQRSSNDLARWLSSLRRTIESHRSTTA